MLDFVIRHANRASFAARSDALQGCPGLLEFKVGFSEVRAMNKKSILHFSKPLRNARFENGLQVDIAKLKLLQALINCFLCIQRVFGDLRSNKKFLPVSDNALFDALLYRNADLSFRAIQLSIVKVAVSNTDCRLDHIDSGLVDVAGTTAFAFQNGCAAPKRELRMSSTALLELVNVSREGRTHHWNTIAIVQGDIRHTAEEPRRGSSYYHF